MLNSSDCIRRFITTECDLKTNKTFTKWETIMERANNGGYCSEAGNDLVFKQMLTRYLRNEYKLENVTVNDKGTRYRAFRFAMQPLREVTNVTVE